MGRPRKTLPEPVEAEIEARAARGESARMIFRAIKGAISVPTIARRMVLFRKSAGAGVCRTCGQPIQRQQ